ncbi:MAG: acetyl-CoA carboxylase carboxyltransferase subunit beta [Planctomycetia bacterium]|nr:acetyl-CoA carboxylase carboxyltransferase subunit beta [Planctomycetia bacterium]
MAWFHRKDKKFQDSQKKSIPDDLWIKCPSCSEIIYKPELKKNHSVCRHCKHHFRITPAEYINLILDDGSAKEVFKNISSVDKLKFKAERKYTDQLKIARNKTNDVEAIRCFEGTISDISIILGVMNFEFIGGSMGVVVGEKVSRAIKLADKNRIPLIIICASGGARMQEGALSLMQLAKTSANLAKFLENGGLYIPLLTNPTTGGVTASFGMLGDINIAEPKALIGFAGPRVIKQTISQDLPEGFQRSEFLLEKGFIDLIVSRSKLKDTLTTVLKTLL